MLRLTRNQSRAVDRIAAEDFGIPTIILMENAARSVADAVDGLRLSRSLTHHCAILCGKGNNGGDGLAAARHLVVRGYRVNVFLCDPPEAFVGDARTNFEIVRAMKLPVRPVDEYDGWDQFAGVTVDAIYGTGYRPPPRMDLRRLRDMASAQMHGVVSIDLPSGLDPDTGKTELDNAFAADVTVSLGSEKVGFAQESAARYLGKVLVADLGLPPEILRQAAASPA